MKCRCSALATPAMHSAILSACFSLSMTHGPPMRNRPPPPISILPTLNVCAIKSNDNRRRGGREDYFRNNTSRPPLLLSGLPFSDLFRPVEHLVLVPVARLLAALAIFVRGLHEGGEQRLRLEWL